MAYSIIALGSNLGDRQSYLDFAISEIDKLCSIVAAAKIYETKPVGYLGQGDFLNSAILVETNLSPLELLYSLQSIENKANRTRPFKNSPRTLDLDIIFYDNLKLSTDTLKIPHPLWQERAFVIDPLLDLFESSPEILKNFGLERNQLCEILEKIKV